MCAILGVDQHTRPEFGFHPHTPLQSSKVDRTEIDLKIGNLLVEAKLTEGNFQTARPELVHRYRDFDEVFEPRSLTLANGEFRSYQLIRSVLAAAFLNCSFCVLCDQRRPDLIADWYRVISAVRFADLRCRLRTLTWQELSRTLAPIQQCFLEKKYGIVAAP